MFERYLFGMREQRYGESVEEYVTSLRKLALSCKFGVTVEERLMDQFMLPGNVSLINKTITLV